MPFLSLLSPNLVTPPPPLRCVCPASAARPLWISRQVGEGGAPLCKHCLPK